MSTSDPTDPFASDAADPFATDNDIITDDGQEIDPFDERPEDPNPLDNADYPGDLEGDAKAEFDAIKAAFQQQDQNQRAQFHTLYDCGYYYTDVFRTDADCERAMKIQARILGIDYEKAGIGWWRNGHMVMLGFQRIADKLGIDISDLT